MEHDSGCEMKSVARSVNNKLHMDRKEWDVVMGQDVESSVSCYCNERRDPFSKFPPTDRDVLMIATIQKMMSYRKKSPAQGFRAGGMRSREENRAIADRQLGGKVIEVDFRNRKKL